jgi:hypothetical protein
VRVIVRFLVPLAIILGVFVYMREGDSKGASARIAQVCGADAGTVNVTSDWPPPAITPDETWVDVGLNPSFGAGSFHGNGPIAPPQSSARIDGLPDGVSLYYRVNTRSKDAWRVQASGSFETDCASTRAAARATPTPAVDVVSAGP